MPEQVPKRRKVGGAGAGVGSGSAETAKQLEEQLEHNPHDVDAWRRLIAQHKAAGRVDELTQLYERLVDLYPLSGEVWTQYVELLLEQSEFKAAEQLFSRALKRVPDVALWSAYLGYVRRVNSVTSATADVAKSYQTIAQAYEFALGKIQHDLQSGPVWKQYLEFIAARPASSTWEQQQKMDELRGIYRRAVSLPVSNIEVLWRAFNSFENDINRTTARKFVDERSNAYMTARSALQQLTALNAGLSRSTFPAARTYSAAERDQLRRWRDLVAFEKANPLGSDDPDTVTARVTLTYREAMAALAFYPEIWFDAAEWAVAQGQTQEAVEWLQQGLHMLPDSFLLSSKLADILEQAGRTEEVVQTYRKLIETLTSRRKSEEEAGTNVTIAYVELLWAVKRKQGLKEARKIFGEARKLAYCTYEIYTASAAMELQNKDTAVAGKIYEIAYKRYSDNPAFLSAYLKFLFRIGDETNAKVVFEKAVGDLDPVALKPLYDQFLADEVLYGDVGAIRKLEARYLEFYPTTDIIELYARRFRQYGADPVRAEFRVEEAAAGPAVAVPSSVSRLLEKLPPAGAYDGPAGLNLDRLVDLVVTYA